MTPETHTSTRMPHTPVPWAIDPDTDDRWSIVDKPGGRWLSNGIATIDYTGGNAEANAAFIVKAVNAHDEMVEVLRKTLRVMSQRDNCLDCFADNLTGEHGALCVARKARAILERIDHGEAGG